MIGLSVSFCVKDIALGKVNENDVEVIVSGIMCENDNEFMAVIEQYKETYWNEVLSAKEIASRLWNSGKIEMPRLKENHCPGIWNGHWVSSREEIEWAW